MKRSIDAAIDKAVLRAETAASTFRFGEITATGPGTVSVILGDTQIKNLPMLAGVTASVGDIAWLVHQGSLMFCIGHSPSTSRETPDA